MTVVLFSHHHRPVLGCVPALPSPLLHHSEDYVISCLELLHGGAALGDGGGLFRCIHSSLSQRENLMHEAVSRRQAPSHKNGITLI